MSLESPDQVTTFLQIGEPIVTPEGPGVVQDIALNLANYDGKLLLEPPAITVKLESGRTIVTCLCTLDFGDENINKAIRDDFDKLWPPMDSVPEAGDVVQERTAISPHYDTSVLFGDMLEEFLDSKAMAKLVSTGLPLNDAVVINNIAYLPLPQDYQRQPNDDVMRFGELSQFLLDNEVRFIPAYYYDAVVSWLRDRGATAQFVLILPL